VALSFDATQSLAIAMAVLFAGSWVVGRVGILRENNIPIPVVGGLLFAILNALLHTTMDFDLSFVDAVKGPLMLAFFTTIGLTADLRQLGRGGTQLLWFAGLCFAYLVLQDGIGVVTAMGLDLHPVVGLLSASITLSGGHGTGAAYAERFASHENIAGAMELAMACATLGLVLGGLIGGPVAGRLIRRNRLEGRGHEDLEDDGVAQSKAAPPMSGETFLRALFLVLLCLVGGEALARAMSGAPFVLPSFVWCLFLGMIIRNASHIFPSLALHQGTVDAIGSLSLGLFLAMALMSLQLWELAAVAGPLFVLLSAQTVGMAVFAMFVTYRVMGSHYDAAVMASGHCGFGLGSTPTALANMEAVTLRYGSSAQAFLVVPLMGAFFIDFLNALVIQGFLALPLFGL
jgi:ESS family glutamate:Na+ symporter